MNLDTRKGTYIIDRVRLMWSVECPSKLFWFNLRGKNLRFVDKPEFCDARLWRVA